VEAQGPTLLTGWIATPEEVFWVLIANSAKLVLKAVASTRTRRRKKENIDADMIYVSAWSNSPVGSRAVRIIRRNQPVEVQ
jgi:hypothetical protein